VSEKEKTEQAGQPADDDDDERIQVLYAFVGVHPNGGEGLLTACTPQGDRKQMITANRQDLISMGLLAQAIAQTGELKVELREYHLHSVFHEFERDEDCDDLPVDVEVVTRQELETLLQAVEAGGTTYGTS